MHDAGALTPAETRRAGIAATIGCALEMYDFLTYAFFAIQIGSTFFPSTSPYLSLMGSLATFGAGFLARPVGAYVLGRYGDRVGRKPAMLMSMGLMGLGILLLVATPGYARIGLAAPVIAIIARLIQGFALGGEVGASTVYMVEAVPPRLRGLGASLQGIAQGIGMTIGTLVGLALSLALSGEELTQFGWRIALLLGASVIPFALLIRRTLPETHEPAVTLANPDHDGPPLARLVIAVATIISGGTMSTYTLNYLATFGQSQLGFSITSAMIVQLAANVSFILGALLGGLFSDRFGRRAGVIWCTAILAAAAIPGFNAVVGTRSVPIFVVVSMAFSLLAVFRAASIYAALAEGTAAAIRTRVFGLVYALPVAVLGGTTQLGLTWLIKQTGTPLAAGWFLAAVNILALVGALALPETAPRNSLSALPRKAMA